MRKTKQTNLTESQRSPRGGFQAVVDLYKQDIDRSLLRENLKLTVDQRFRKFTRTMQLFEELKRAGEAAREGDK